MLHLRLTGRFTGMNGADWRAEIMPETSLQITEEKELQFDTARPVVITWPHMTGPENVHGSTAELRVQHGTYSALVDEFGNGQNRTILKIYRNGRPYWAGVHDGKFCTEPEPDTLAYVVKFKDFAALEHRIFRLTGPQTLYQITIRGIQRICTDTKVLDYSLVSVEPGEQGARRFRWASVDCNQFKPESGQPPTWAEVLGMTFQAQGLHIIQRAGRVFVYDLDGVFHSGIHKAIYWRGMRAQERTAGQNGAITRLSGETALDAGILATYTERGSRRQFVIRSEVQDLKAERSQTTYQDIRPAATLLQ